MDPVTVIVTALASGAGSGLKDAASSATAAGKYHVTVKDSQGVQVGDHNTMTLNLGGTPDQ